MEGVSSLATFANIALAKATSLDLLEEKSNEMIKNFSESSYKVNKNRIMNAAYVSKNYIFNYLKYLFNIASRAAPWRCSSFAIS